MSESTVGFLCRQGFKWAGTAWNFIPVKESLMRRSSGKRREQLPKSKQHFEQQNWKLLTLYALKEAWSLVLLNLNLLNLLKKSKLSLNYPGSCRDLPSQLRASSH